MPVFERTVNFFQASGFDGLQALEFNKNMYAFGGYNGTSYLGATFMSPNGQDITIVSAQGDETAFTPRADHRAVVHDNRIVMTGGQDAAGGFNDCWIYDNKWTRCSTNIGGSRYGHAIYSFDNRLWIVGGFTDSDVMLSDVWCSYDGVIWRQLIAAHPVLARSYAGYCVYDNKMWLIGGWDGSAAISDCYCSVNGITWERQELPADFPAVAGHTVTVFDNKMVLIGGATTYSNRQWGAAVAGNLWYSFHGAEWIRGADDLEISRAVHAAFAYTHKQRMIVTCGTDGTNRFADIWQTRGVEFLTKAF